MHYLQCLSFEACKGAVARCTLDGSPVHRWANITYFQTWTSEKVHCGRKPENPEKTTRTLGEHVNSVQKELSFTGIRTRNRLLSGNNANCSIWCVQPHLIHTCGVLRVLQALFLSNERAKLSTLGVWTFLHLQGSFSWIEPASRTYMCGWIKLQAQEGEPLIILSPSISTSLDSSFAVLSHIQAGRHRSRQSIVPLDGDMHRKSTRLQTDLSGGLCPDTSWWSWVCNLNTLLSLI